MDDAYIASFDIAINKTYTSASLKMSTAQLADLSQPGQDLYGIQFTNNGRIVIFGGGEVLEADGQIIGALGVSGGSAAEDTAIAAYGKEVFKEVLELSLIHIYLCDILQYASCGEGSGCAGCSGEYSEAEST